MKKEKKKFKFFIIDEAEEIKLKDFKVIKEYVDNLIKKGYPITTLKKDKAK